jgi:stage IV sporulation protein FB
MANLALALFNLIPAIPMDGGRVLRALLSTRFGFLRGTRMAARVGQALAIAFAAAGMFSGNGILVLIGLFIFVAASGQAGIARVRSAASGLLASDMMITDFKSLLVDATLEDAADALIRTSQHEFPIVDGQRHVRGVVTRDRIVKTIHELGMHAAVADIMEQVPQILSDQRAEEIVPLLEEGAEIVAINDESAKLRSGLID